MEHTLCVIQYVLVLKKSSTILDTFQSMTGDIIPKGWKDVL
jgi:hypothetical protein